MSYKQPQKPIKEFRITEYGVTIAAAIWRYEDEQDGGRTSVNFSIRLSKRYYDRDTKSWQNADHYYRPYDLLLVREVTQAAYNWIMMQERDPNELAEPSTTDQQENAQSENAAPTG